MDFPCHTCLTFPICVSIVLKEKEVYDIQTFESSNKYIYIAHLIKILTRKCSIFKEYFPCDYCKSTGVAEWPLNYDPKEWINKYKEFNFIYSKYFPTVNDMPETRKALFNLTWGYYEQND